MDQLHRSSLAVIELPVWAFRQGLRDWKVCQGMVHTPVLGQHMGKPLWSCKDYSSRESNPIGCVALCHHRGGTALLLLPRRGSSST